MIEPLQLPKPPGGREIRELTPEEIQSVAHIFAEAGTVVPQQATFVGAVENGKVLGFLVLQPKLHAEPMWIAPGESQLFASIVHEAERVILSKVGPCWAYTFAPAGKVSQMAASMGMQLEPWCVFSKLVMPEAPGKPVIALLDPMEAEVPSAEPTPPVSFVAGEGMLNNSEPVESVAPPIVEGAIQ